MTYDPSKKITVSYNPLNLPRLVEFDNSDFIEYTYTATGTKLRKTVTSWKTTTGGTTDYAGQFLYQDNELSCIFTPVGRIVPMQYNDEIFWKHEYNLKDYLGNTRIVFAAHPHGQPELMQQTSYYPFGMTLQQQNFGGLLNQPNKLLYNGKELQDDELAGVSLDWYDFGFRFYDAALGRFPSLDPKADAFHWVSPYNYAENNPVTGIDLWGLQYLDHNKARIIAQHGQIRLKTANFHNVTRNRINAMNNNPKFWKKGEIGINHTVGRLQKQTFKSNITRPEPANMDNTYGAVDPAYRPSDIKTERGAKKDGTPDMRQTQRTIAAGSPKAKGAAGAILAINAINYGLELAGGMLVSHDKSLVEEHASAEFLGSALNDLNTAIGDGMIPDEYMNVGDLTNILNVILQGENTTDNQDIMNIGVDIIQNISGNYNEEWIKK
jgi:RHS repeat-associated protein